MFYTGLFFGLVMGVSLGWYGRRWKIMRQYRKTTATSPTPVPKQEPCYGHPWPPVPALRRKLPRPPQGHVWETTVSTNDSGHDILKVSLVNVSTEENVASMTRNLTVGEYRTYAHEYIEYAILKKETFNNELLQPILDWAYPVVNKIATGGQVTDYEIG
jgi:hypothetical protein